MPNRSSKTDDAQNALRIVEEAIGEPLAQKEKNPAAVTLGHLGGLKGGPARAKKLSKKRKHEIATDAAKTRWKSKARKSLP